ncbi:transporter substrate-binding domain-containing protein [Sporosarcina pasteurii]|uniref:L-cystine-binding protein tcyJ n=1 Tax=Sporosarcina pasteurii TaxID=1474 RepID=A0A380BQZ8_SPOPA|nr:transporter substrate-binding domain-containing protein [Sporosarcina pasteurii]MDS9471085.1 transporter substrate-binding domain-containing protein [Sporosarcina pasteurii]QBQ05272.1 transporter substrate-binding domain-containing protein [Sporosarcina pasteurii]SUJ04511.1 L-cystine-binding protein tcyJ precursor [Sporosarcina pasteurii]
MKLTKVLKAAAFSAGIAALLVGCSSSDNGSVKADGDNDIRKVKVAYVQSSKPVTYTDENGNAAGYDVEVLKAVDELLPQYEFEFVGTSDDDLLVGVEQGKYQVGVKNAFWTEERTAKFIYPKEFVGLSSTGLVLKKENAAVKTLDDFASAGFSLAPIAANNAQYTVIAEHNEKNPDNPINLKAGDTFSVDVVQWVNEGRVDGAVIIEASFNRQVTAGDGPYHHLKDDVVYNEFAVIKTWPLFNKKEQEFADAFDEALKEVKEQKIPNDLSIEFYGRDLFELLDTVER